jgi:hypothetical protein
MYDLNEHIVKVLGDNEGVNLRELKVKAVIADEIMEKVRNINIRCRFCDANYYLCYDFSSDHRCR